jgi:hypothetical protein
LFLQTQQFGYAEQPNKNVQQVYPNFYNNWQTISTIYGIARLSQIGLEAAIKRTNVDAIIMSVDSRLSNEARSTADKIRKQLQNPENFAEYADNLIDDYNRIINESKNLDITEWVSRRTTSGEVANHYLFKKSYNLDEFKLPYKPFTLVKDVTIKENDVVYCVEYLDAKRPGSWLTTKSFASMERMRRELALLEDFKGSNLGGGIVVRKYRVKKAFNTRQGVVGEQYETKGSLAGQELQGGAIQIEFGKYNPWDPAGTNKDWEKYLENTSNQNDGINKPFEKILR